MHGPGTRRRAAGAELIETKGGHHFDGDYAKAAEAIWERLESAKPVP